MCRTASELARNRFGEAPTANGSRSGDQNTFPALTPICTGAPLITTREDKDESHAVDTERIKRDR